MFRKLDLFPSSGERRGTPTPVPEMLFYIYFEFQPMDEVHKPILQFY
jgi:hypothetical protein